MLEPLKLKDIESSVEMPTCLINKVEVVDDGKTFIYRGCAHNLFVDGLSIRGAVSLEKAEIKIKKIKLRIGRLFSRQLEEREFEFEERAWFADTGRNTDGWACDFFISRGVPKIERDQDFCYRGALIGKLATNGILVSDALLNAVFGPVDQKLLDVYKTIVSFGGFPKKSN
jgi:hypothetical protein